NILYRYQDGVLTDEPLWDPETGRFPCGAMVAGFNDMAGSSCFDVHERLNINTHGCPFPAGYPRSAGPMDAGAADASPSEMRDSAMRDANGGSPRTDAAS